MDNSEILYSLDINDLQTVAEDEIGRTLNIEEIAIIKQLIEKQINWYEIIADAINQYISEKQLLTI